MGLSLHSDGTDTMPRPVTVTITCDDPRAFWCRRSIELTITTADSWPTEMVRAAARAAGWTFRRCDLVGEIAICPECG